MRDFEKGLAAAQSPVAGMEPTQPHRGQSAQEQRPTLTFADLPVGFEPRDGDVMVVHYGAVKVPLPAGKFGSIEVGGESYSRELRKGDDAGEQYEKIYAFLKGRAERAAKEKVANWHSQFSKGEG